MVRLRKIVTLLAVSVLGLGLAACLARIETRGNIPDTERLAELRPGEYSRKEVLEMLGSPSSIASFDSETWYYISERTETVAFFAPEIKERKVLMVRFDKEGILSDMRQIGLEEGFVVEPVGRETPTAGNKITVMEQLFGNLGRFNKDGK